MILPPLLPTSHAAGRPAPLARSCNCTRSVNAPSLSLPARLTFCSVPSPQARAKRIASDLYNIERARFKESVAARGTPHEGAAQQAFEVAQAAAGAVRMPAAVVLPTPSRASQPRTVCLPRRLSHSSLSTAAPRRSPPGGHARCVLSSLAATLLFSVFMFSLTSIASCFIISLLSYFLAPVISVLLLRCSANMSAAVIAGRLFNVLRAHVAGQSGAP